MGYDEKGTVSTQRDPSPIVSIIVPLYNVEQYLHSCLDSVLAQTYPHFEVILVDDGSTDASNEICREFCEKDMRFRLYRKENGGASSARNFGLDRANGKYIYFLDSDDEIMPDTLEKAVACALENRADLVFFEARTKNDDGTFSSGQYDYHKQYQPGAPYLIMEEMTAHKEFHVSTPLFFSEKALFDKNGLRFREGIISEDMIMAYKLFSLAKRAAHLHEYLYIRRYRPLSVTTSAATEKNYVSAAAVYREVASLRKTLPAEKQSPGHLIRCAYLVLNVYRKMSPEIKKKYENEHDEIIADILANNAYGDSALRLDCKSRLLWGAYKLKQKILKS